MDKPPEGDRFYIPIEQFGSVYEGQWVERRREYDQQLGLWAHAVTTAPLYRDDVSGKLNLIASRVFTDWNFCGDEGRLPKPWQNAQAFKALMNTDEAVWTWLMELAVQPITEKCNGVKERYG